MNEAMVAHYTTQALWVVLWVSLPVVLVACAVGVLVGLLQALTQVQDQTLQFLLKLIAVSVTLAMAFRWMGSMLLNYATQVFDLISKVSA